MPDSNSRRDLMQTLAHHDAAILSLGGQLKTLQGEVHSGFSNINSAIQSFATKLEQVNARPTFDFSRAVSTVLSLSVLFSMVVGGIIWVTTNQFAGVVAEQKSTNERDKARLDFHADQIEKLRERVGWVARTEPSPKR